ncbi:sialic acid-binding Ig-like lectin 12 [Etheostoma cragini]|uniref:sialic acid-binding Ig-like lectin 12 n=1 Tax=Etheostoma cragini TaxID=417921 RepID=UPI00155E03AF|nr:sialic acid-binding Ig-like lectin 12 [Etheostoma cragini]
MMSVIAVQSVKMVTANMLLSVFFVSGALAVCYREPALNITAPKNLEALSGSCLLIPCNFSSKPDQDFSSARPTFGVWIKKEYTFNKNISNIIFNSSGRVTTYPMNITGDLSQKQCTTLFSSLIPSYTDTYYFRIENRPFLATAECDPLQITVRDSPPRPRIEVPGDLKEKESVTISCSAPTPCPHSPPKLTWNLQPDPHNNKEENTDRTFTTKIQKTIALSDTHDGLTISCNATYPVNEGRGVKTAEETKTLSVSYAPKNTSVSISPSGLVSAGSWVNLTCSSRAKPPPSFSWFKNSKDGDLRVTEGDFYSFNVTRVTDGVYYCVATNDLGNQTSSWIHLKIAENSDSSLIWASSVGGIIFIFIIIVIIFLAVSVCDTVGHLTLSSGLRCHLVCSYLMWKEPAAHNISCLIHYSQSQRGEEMSLQKPASKTEEDIHYGEIDFSRQNPEASSSSEQDRGQQQDSLYAQVKVSQTADSRTQTADGPEDLYAQVKKN